MAIGDVAGSKRVYIEIEIIGTQHAIFITRHGGVYQERTNAIYPGRNSYSSSLDVRMQSALSRVLGWGCLDCPLTLLSRLGSMCDLDWLSRWDDRLCIVREHLA